MASVMRYRYGETNPVEAAVNSATVIEIGDLVYLEVDDARPASDQSDQSTEAANQDKFHNKFLGVAMQASPSGSTTPIRVATSGVFEFTCASATFELGDLIGPVEKSNGTQLENQKVAKVPGTTRAIGRVSKAAASVTSVLVAITSTVMAGGPDSPSTTSSESAP